MIAYVLGNSLYLNITNRCPNDCTFCIRKTSTEDALWLTREPSATEIVEAAGDVTEFDEIVFCGFGEPLMRPDVVCNVARALRGAGVPIRVDTNGLASMIHNRDIVAELQGLVDAVSISMVAHDGETYSSLTNCPDGERGYEAMLEFARRCLQVVPTVEMSVVDWPGVDVEACRRQAEALGARFRVRQHRQDLKARPIRRCEDG